MPTHKQGSLRAILGTMTFGNQVDRPIAEQMINYFLDAGYTEIDTAYLYNDGKSEEVLGEILPNLDRDSFSIATKAAPPVKGHLKPDALREQLETSLTRMKLDFVDIFYLHWPDPSTPIEETLRGCGELHREGKFKTLGLSNYASWEVAHIVHQCQRSALPAPAVYQGMYNGLTRQVERELFPALRKLDIPFYAYNPLAAGLLSGRYKNFEETPSEGRFKEMSNYVDRYWRQPFFDATRKVLKACDESGVPVLEAAHRWLIGNSELGKHPNDGLILGVSKLDHLRQNLEFLNRPPLSEEICQAFTEAWALTEPYCPKYFRP